MVELTKENFEAEVLKAEGKVFVDFYGDGCVPCAALMPFVHQYAETYGDKMKFCALNTTKDVYKRQGPGGRRQRAHPDASHLGGGHGT